MGNIGNLNSEQRAFIAKNSPESDNIGPSRIQRDLSSSPHQENYMEQVMEKEMSVVPRLAGKIPHVCVVGAGIAGLRCAALLLQHGAKVTILEARDRIGGRLCQSDALGHAVDLGPNWIHGTDKNPILDLAKQTNTITMNWDGRQSVFDHLGKLMPGKEATENTEIVWGIIEQAMKLSNEESATIPAEKSLFNFFEEQVEQMFPSEVEGVVDKDAQRKQKTILQMSEMWGAFVGSPIHTQSLKFFWLEECIDGENLFVADTYHKILEKIKEPALKAEIKLGHKVTKIKSSGNEESPSVCVDIQGQGSQTFDEVVMTAPLGWLKHNMNVFEPELPKRLQEGINAIGYGHLDKVYINFPTAFWNTSELPIDSSSSISEEDGFTMVKATAAPLPEASQDQTTAAPLPEASQDQTTAASDFTVDPSHYPGFSHWNAPTYAPETNPKQWNQEAVNLAALPGKTAHPTLLFYTFGPTSLHIAKMLSINPPSAHHGLLSAFFYPYFSRLPNFSPTDPLHQPSEILATAWANDELAGHGSYSNFQVGLERGNEDIEVMRKGMPERGVWLAGEHTAPFVALGTVTGAWWAGEGVAKRLIRAYELEKKEASEKRCRVM